MRRPQLGSTTRQKARHRPWSRECAVSSSAGSSPRSEATTGR